MQPEDLPAWMQDWIGDHWTDVARRTWGSFDNYINAFDTNQFHFLADHTGDLDNMLPDSDFSLAYAHWMRTGFDRDTLAYANLLVEAEFYDSIDDAAEHYEVGSFR